MATDNTAPRHEKLIILGSGLLVTPLQSMQHVPTSNL